MLLKDKWPIEELFFHKIWLYSSYVKGFKYIYVLTNKMARIVR
jgi:hypothetical protein